MELLEVMSAAESLPSSMGSDLRQYGLAYASQLSITEKFKLQPLEIKMDDGNDLFFSY